MVRGVRYFVLHPAATVAVVAAVVVVVALIVAAPLYIGYVPGVSSLRSQTAPTATEDYLRGNRDYNADLVWNSLDADAQTRLTSQGGTKDDLQQQMNAAKQRGVQTRRIVVHRRQSIARRHEHAVLSGGHAAADWIRSSTISRICSR